MNEGSSSLPGKPTKQKRLRRQSAVREDLSLIIAQPANFQYREAESSQISASIQTLLIPPDKPPSPPYGRAIPAPMSEPNLSKQPNSMLFAGRKSLPLILVDSQADSEPDSVDSTPDMRNPLFQKWWKMKFIKTCPRIPTVNDFTIIRPETRFDCLGWAMLDLNLDGQVWPPKRIIQKQVESRRKDMPLPSCVSSHNTLGKTPH